MVFLSYKQKLIYTMPINSIDNNVLAAFGRQVPDKIVNAIQTASAKTGVSFAYLMEKAAAESSFNPQAKAKTSSATGLFQFIESTWMDMVNKHGHKYGIEPQAQSRENLLELRKDPAIASFMAAEFAGDNKAYLEKTVQRPIGETELYFAHFMGAGGASAFLSQLDENPLSIGADLFPKAARANQAVFYDRESGAPNTLRAIYDHFDKKFSTDNNSIGNKADFPVTDVPPATMAHAPTVKKGYTHIPPSLNKPIHINDNVHAAMGSLFAYGSKPHISAGGQTINNLIPLSLYSDLSNPSAILLKLFE